MVNSEMWFSRNTATFDILTFHFLYLYWSSERVKVRSEMVTFYLERSLQNRTPISANGKSRCGPGTARFLHERSRPPFRRRIQSLSKLSLAYIQGQKPCFHMTRSLSFAEPNRDFSRENFDMPVVYAIYECFGSAVHT